MSNTYFSLKIVIVGGKQMLSIDQSLVDLEEGFFTP